MINSRHILNLSIELITKPQALGRTSCYKCNGTKIDLITKPQALGRTSCYKCNGTKREAGRGGVGSLSCFLKK
jgi:hypothetical protein